jgi:large subunit ribosomal protein L21
MKDTASSGMMQDIAGKTRCFGMWTAFDRDDKPMYNLGFSRFRVGFRRGKKSFNQLMRFHMYAVIKTGGKQYKVVAGEKFKVEQIPADIGSEITLDQVLALGAGETIKFGAPLVAGATVLATVVSHGRHDKVKIFKMRRRKHYQKHQGHRQNYTELQIVSING